jgi:NADH-quinone oxidoreductase subunit L
VSPFSGAVTHAADAVPTAAAASGVFSLVWLLIALPLAGAAILLLAGRRSDKWGHWLGVLSSLASFVVAVILFFGLLGQAADARTVRQHLFDWIAVGTFNVPFDLRLDQLSMTFVLLITGVGTLIHVYSVGYMSHDHDRRRFFAYLNLFVASMLLLVLADNYLLLYVGWEGVGLASYLLIGFWFVKDTAAVASKKAFIVNRVGDVGLSLAVMLMFVTFGSVTFTGVLSGADRASESSLTWIGLALLLAAAGKSAQFPLQSWLLDAMEGPTPVSALIHAATMVTAGVYLIVRSGAIFDAAPAARTAVMVIGAITLLMGAIIGSAKDDIKKALAGSTMSQIGYMILAAGLGPVGYAFAIFHLVVHGFFKADMFLGAGSVMHGMNDRVDMRRYGAVRAVMVTTWITFGAGYLAILGIPPFAGFYSKDKIIEAAFSVSPAAGVVTLVPWKVIANRRVM